MHKEDSKQKTAYEIGVRLVGSEMCIRDSFYYAPALFSVRAPTVFQHCLTLKRTRTQHFSACISPLFQHFLFALFACISTMLQHFSAYISTLLQHFFYVRFYCAPAPFARAAENFEKEKENGKVRTKIILKKKKKTTRFGQR